MSQENVKIVRRTYEAFDLPGLIARHTRKRSSPSAHTATSLPSIVRNGAGASVSQASGLRSMGAQTNGREDGRRSDTTPADLAT